MAVLAVLVMLGFFEGCSSANMPGHQAPVTETTAIPVLEEPASEECVFEKFVLEKFVLEKTTPKEPTPNEDSGSMCEQVKWFNSEMKCAKLHQYLNESEAMQNELYKRINN